MHTPQLEKLVKKDTKPQGPPSNHILLHRSAMDRFFLEQYKHKISNLKDLISMQLGLIFQIFFKTSFDIFTFSNHRGKSMHKKFQKNFFQHLNLPH